MPDDLQTSPFEELGMEGMENFLYQFPVSAVLNVNVDLCDIGDGFLPSPTRIKARGLA
jgi:hypothetical protein